MGDSPRIAPCSVGRRLGGRYRLEGRIGRGAMAEVWEATDEVLGRRVAVKVLFAHLAEDPDFVARFRREALAVARISHPGIVAVYDTVRDTDTDAIVLELVEGDTLRERLSAEGVLDEDEVLRLGIALADALEAAHRAGVVHRDIKPSNVLLAVDGTPKLADFGVASDGEEGLTAIGTLVGTAAYVSPEQVEGAPADARSDVYGLACVLYEAACGRPPFRESNDAATALARLRDDAPDVRSVRPALSVGIAGALADALSRDPAARTSSATALRVALQRVARGLPDAGPRSAHEDPTLLDTTAPHRIVTRDDPPTVVAARPVPVATRASSPNRPRRPARGAPVAPLGHRRRWWWAAMTALLTGGALVLVGALVGNPGERPSPTTTTAVPSGPLGVAAVVTVDPFGSGTPGENDAARDRLVDGDPATTWRTESYADQEFGTKPGVGFALRLDAPAEVDGLVIDTTSEGWVAEISVLADLDDVPPATPGQRVELRRGRQDVELEPADGRVVLVWITRLGDGTGRHLVELGEVTPSGVPRRG